MSFWFWKRKPSLPDHAIVISKGKRGQFRWRVVKESTPMANAMTGVTLLTLPRTLFVQNVKPGHDTFTEAKVAARNILGSWCSRVDEVKVWRENRDDSTNTKTITRMA